MNRNHRSISDVIPGWDARAIVVSLLGLAVFVVLSLLVHKRMMANFDMFGIGFMRAHVSGALTWLSALLGAAFSVEAAALIVVVLGVYLWRRGVGQWSLAPLLIVAVTVVEVGVKCLIHQPLVAKEWQSDVYFPLANIALLGSFPSGHAARCAFLCTFFTGMLWARSAKMGWLAGIFFAILMAAGSVSRVYLRVHWPTDVIGGIILGTVSGYLAVLPVMHVFGRGSPDSSSPENEPSTR